MVQEVTPKNNTDLHVTMPWFFKCSAFPHLAHFQQSNYNSPTIRPYTSPRFTSRNITRHLYNPIISNYNIPRTQMNHFLEELGPLKMVPVNPTRKVCPSSWGSPNIGMDDRTKICGRHCLFWQPNIVGGSLVGWFLKLISMVQLFSFDFGDGVFCWKKYPKKSGMYKTQWIMRQTYL